MALLVVLSVGTLMSCENNNSGTARYRITFTINWTTSATGTNPIPSGAHFTTLYGATHKSSYSVWRSGARASAGLESLAETGGTSTLRSEIQSKISSQEAQQIISIAGTGATGSSSVTLTLRKDYPLVSLASMLAPSSDWFTGISAHSLLDSNGDWKATHTVQLRVYDAGTEADTNVFCLGNADLSNKQNIARLTGSSSSQSSTCGSNTTTYVVGFVSPKDVVGTITFTRL